MYTGSLLPKYRGASPIQQSVLNGDIKTGITTMYMEEQMDTGNIIEQEEMLIERTDTSKTMFEKLAILGAKILVSTLKKIEENNGNIISIKQNDDDATYTSMITKEMAIIDFNKSFEEIVDFAELSEFIDVPLKNFSSGMVARLGFAISTIVKPDILIVDEILSVGDFKFQEKSLNKIKSMMKDGVTVLMVSHSLDQIEKMCNRVVWLENGSIKKIGLTKEICSEYKNS